MQIRRSGFIKHILIFTICLIGLFLIYFKTSILHNNRDNSLGSVTLSGNSINIEVADTDETRSRGLSGRNYLRSDEGMLFIFNKPGKYYFWMKEMLFPLDFVWINGNHVVDLTENVNSPDTDKFIELPSFTSRFPFDKVLEINAGMIRKSNIKINDLVEYK